MLLDELARPLRARLHAATAEVLSAAGRPATEIADHWWRADDPQRFTYDTIAHSKPIMEFVISMVGADRIMIGSDYCFDMGLADPVGTVQRLEAVPAAERELIRGDRIAEGAAGALLGSIVISVVSMILGMLDRGRRIVT